MRRLPLFLATAALVPSLAPAALADYPYDANPAFASEGRSEGIVVAVIDSGVDYLHPLLKDSIWRNPGEIAGNGIDDDHNGYVDDIHGWDFARSDAYPFDQMPPPPKKPECKEGNFGCKLVGGLSYFGEVVFSLLRPGAAGHGTHVAGIVREVSAGTATILPLRIDYHTTNDEWARQVVKALEYASSAGARVVNMSFGVYPSKLDRDGTIEVKKMIKSIAAKRGMVMAIAAGNEKTDMAEQEAIAPGGINERHVLTVGAVDETGELADFSNIGEGIVDVYAPGVNILSTWPGGGMQEASGTSMATPFIAGLAAKLIAAGPRARSSEIASRIREISRDVTTGFDDEVAQVSRPVVIPVILRDTAAGF